jgi:ATP:ADP antiporter, AAA family
MALSPLRQLFSIRKDELLKALPMSFFFFLVITTFWILKPIKRGLLIGYYKEQPFDLFGMQLGGAQTEQLAKVVNMLVALCLAFFIAFLYRKLSRQNILFVFCVLFGLSLLLYARLVNNPGTATVWSFYVFGDMFNTAMVTFFWSFMSDIVTSEEAKRTYGIVGLGGVIGGFVGASIVNASITSIGRGTMVTICIIPIVLMAIIGFMVNHRVKADPHSDINSPAVQHSHSARKGIKLLLASKYLMAIAGIVALYELTSNIVDFQLSASVEQFIGGKLERDAYFGFVGQINGIVSIIVQLFITSFVMRRFGVGTALLILPASLLLGSLGFLALPTLAFASLMSVSDNSLNYSINQSAKEALYVPTSRSEKYQTKAFIDMFIQRFGKVIAVGLNLLVVAFISIANVRWLSLASITILLFWIVIARFAGHSFDKLATKREPSGDSRIDLLKDTSGKDKFKAVA